METNRRQFIKVGVGILTAISTLPEALGKEVKDNIPEEAVTVTPPLPESKYEQITRNQFKSMVTQTDFVQACPKLRVGVRYGFKEQIHNKMAAQPAGSKVFFFEVMGRSSIHIKCAVLVD